MEDSLKAKEDALRKRLAELLRVPSPLDAKIRKAMAATQAIAKRVKEQGTAGLKGARTKTSTAGKTSPKPRAKRGD